MGKVERQRIYNLNKDRQVCIVFKTPQPNKTHAQARFRPPAASLLLLKYSKFSS